MDTLELALKLILDNLHQLSDYELTHLSKALDDEIDFRALYRNAIALGIIVKEDED